MLKRFAVLGRRFVRIDCILMLNQSEFSSRILNSTNRSTGPIKISISDSVATLELNNPPVNVLSRKLLEEGFQNDALSVSFLLFSDSDIKIPE